MTTTTPHAPKFAAFIRDTGAGKLAEQLGVSRFTIYGWLRYATNTGKGRPFRPDPRRLAAILRLSRGKLTAEDIYPGGAK